MHAVAEPDRLCQVKEQVVKVCLATMFPSTACVFAAMTHLVAAFPAGVVCLPVLDMLSQQHKLGA